MQFVLSVQPVFGHAKLKTTESFVESKLIDKAMDTAAYVVCSGGGFFLNTARVPNVWIAIESTPTVSVLKQAIQDIESIIEDCQYGK